MRECYSCYSQSLCQLGSQDVTLDPRQNRARASPPESKNPEAVALCSSVLSAEPRQQSAASAVLPSPVRVPASNSIPTAPETQLGNKSLGAGWNSEQR